MVKPEKETLSDNDLKKYLPLSEASRILQMNTLSANTVRTNIKTLNIRRITKDRRLYFHVEDVNNVLNDAKDFWGNYYAYHEVMRFQGVTKGKLENSKLKKIKIPSGYNALLANTRFPNGDYKISSSAYNKNDFNAIRKDFQKRNNEQYSIKGMSDEEIKKYISLEEASKILGMENFSFNVIYESIRAFNIRQVIKSREKYYHVDDVNKVLDEVKNFYDNHYTFYDITHVLKITKTAIERCKMTKVKIPPGYNPVLYSKRFPKSPYKVNRTAFKKEEVDKFFNDYISLQEVLNITNFTKGHFNNVVRKSCKIRTLNGHTLFNKDDVNKLIKKQQKFLSEYIDMKSAREKYSSKGFNIHFRELNLYDAPYYAITRDNRLSIAKVRGVYKISEIKKYVENRVSNKVDTDVEGATPFETFTYRLNNHVNWVGFNKSSKYTEQKWFEFIKNYLNRSLSKKSTMMSNINRYVRCTFIIKEMLERNAKTEVYLLTANEINLFLRSISYLSIKKFIYYFLREVYGDIQANIALNKRCFKLSEIKKPPRKLTKLEDNNNEDSNEIIYDFSVYSKVFKYQLDLDLHTKKSIEEIQTKGTAIYASVWLYAMLHLNNAWRHGDVRDFPKLEIEDLQKDFGINSIEWFNDNKIELPLARAVIYSVIQWEFIVSKTQMKGRFFCSDELTLPIATAIIILTIFNDNFLVMDSSNTLMKFNTKYNEVNRSMLKKFFEGLDVQGFNFSSKKFNKSIMTYITYLANMSGDNKSLEYAKWMRSHKHIGSTLNYIDFNIEAVEKLSKMLFSRGEFGYITSLLINKLNNGITKDFNEISEQVYAVNQTFGDAFKVNSTVSFLNSIRAERESVVDYLSTKTLQESQEMLSDIFTRKLPSKEGTDVQCLHSKTGCQRNDLDNCFECPYHIPSIYALSKLCNSLTHNINDYFASENKARKFRLSIKIHRKKQILIEAIQKFGKDYVYGCLGMSRDEFLDKLALVEINLIS